MMQISSGAPISLGGVPLTRTTASTVDTFVDSVSGLDANAGTSKDAPKQTLAGVTWGSTKTVSLKRGSVWRESTSTAAILASYGLASAALPIIDGQTVVTVWTAHATIPNAWQASVAHEVSIVGRLTVTEDGNLLTRVAAAGSLVAGSYVGVEASAASPSVITLIATGSGNPNSNGKVYAVTARSAGVVLGDNSTLVGIRAQNVFNNNGAIEVGKYSSIKQCLAVNGTKHNLLIGSGVLEDCIACRADQLTAIEPSSTAFVGYSINAAGLALVMRRCMSIADGYDSSGPALIMHDSTGNSFATFYADQIASDTANGFNPSAYTQRVRGLYSKNQASPWACYSDAFIMSHSQVLGTTGTTGMILQGIVGGGSYTFIDCAFYDVGSNDGIIRLRAALSGCNLTFTNCVFYHSGFRSTMTSEGMASGSITVNNCIFVYTSNGNPIIVPSGVTYAGNNNVFVPQTTVNLTYQGALSTTLAAWQLATGQDANSIVVTAANLGTLFAGTVANGDFRLNGSGSGALAAALSAGVRNKWDWNARGIASGAPTAWPVIPTTLTQCETYCESPTAWSF